MADYKKMYHILFIEMNDTINRFQERLLEVENMYISCEDIQANIVKGTSENKEKKDRVGEKF